MPELTAQQREQYFRVRLDPYKLRHSKAMEHRSRCPLHDGGNPSQFWVDLAEGNWCCFSCGEKGGSHYTLEQRLLAREIGRSPMHDEVMRSLESILGTPFTQRTYAEVLDPKAKKGWNRRQARDWYRYDDEIGREVFTVWRFVDRGGRKLTPADRPCPCKQNPEAECPNECEEGRIWSTKGVRRVLYRLPSVIAASLVIVVEGEKNANDLNRALSDYIKTHRGFPLGSLTLDHIAVTTNAGGARAWKLEHGYGRFFAGKVVIKLGDNDEPGRQHDRDVCADVSQHALQAFTLDLPVGEGEDISDFLERNSIEEFLKLLPSRKEWKTPKRSVSTVAEELAPRTLLVKPSELVATAGHHLEGDWLVEGLIERGTRGLVVAPPKTGKSLLFLELALCLATRQSFLGIRPYGRHIRCAVISREDGPRMVYRRLMQLAAPRGLTQAEVDRFLFVNTEEQSSRFKIDRDEDLREMAEWLKSSGVEFVVVDVLNRLHDKQENNSDDMTRVMQRFDELAALSGAQVCVIGHTNKGGGVKGSTAIEGWADYVARLEQHEADDTMKTLYLKTKSRGSVTPRTLRYWQSEDESSSRISLVVGKVAA
jgi:KaiC/GvpD/RAD55 family RecA-like ATPase